MPTYLPRDPAVCVILVHSLASVRAVEDALKIKIPPNARIVRNLTHAAQNMHDHPVHFYQLCALDWVDVVSALSADAGKTADLSNAVSGRPQSKKYYEGLKAKLKAFVDSGQLGPFANAYWGHPAYKLPAEANLMAVGHYLDNLRQQVHAAQMTAIWGAKKPAFAGSSSWWRHCRWSTRCRSLSQVSIYAERTDRVHTGRLYS